MRLFSLFSSQQPTPAPTIDASQQASASATATPTSGGVATAAPNSTAAPKTAPPIADTVEIQGNKPQTPEPQKAPASVKDSKPFYQPILDFFKNLYEKFMDFFTPTSKEAIEKSLAKAQLKSELYEARIARSQIALSQKGISSDVQAILAKDGQKAKKKLEALTPKIEKLSARYEKLIGATTAPTTTAAEKAAAAATTESAEHAAQNTAADATEETAESLEKGLKEFAETLAQQGEEVFNKLKQESPEVFEVFQKLLKGFLK